MGKSKQPNTVEDSLEDKEKIINSLHEKTSRIFSIMIESPSFFEYIEKTYKQYPQDLNNCYQKIKLDLESRIVSRYTQDPSYFGHLSYDMIKLEEKVWFFVENNPELFQSMIEDIAYDENCADIFTFSGFCFIDTFIHNGIFDDWEIFVAQKNTEVFFINENKEEEYKSKGYTVTYLSENIMNTIIDQFTLAPETKENRKNSI